MKKLSNMQTLKNLVNADVLECIKCRIYGVQAYNISANEYEVIVKFAKQGGRYYFIDRDGNRYLASRYDRAEDVAADILENIECTALVVNALVDEIQAKGKVSVDYEFLDLFLNECDRREIEAESVENNYLDNGEMYTVYRLKSEETAKDDTQSEETAADEQQSSENEENAAACEPSKFAGILAKVKSSARKVCEKVALIMALAFVMVVTFAAFFGMVYFLPDVLDLFGIECGSWAAIALSLLLFCTVIMDACVFVELNTMAAIDYLFPSLFGSAQKPGFTKPFSFWHRVFSSDML